MTTFALIADVIYEYLINVTAYSFMFLIIILFCKYTTNISTIVLVFSLIYLNCNINYSLMNFNGDSY